MTSRTERILALAQTVRCWDSGVVIDLNGANLFAHRVLCQALAIDPELEYIPGEVERLASIINTAKAPTTQSI